MLSYADADAYITAEAVGLNVPATSDNAQINRDAQSAVLSGDPYVANETWRTAANASEAVWVEPDIIFGERGDYNYDGAVYLPSAADSTENTLANLENYISRIDETASNKSLKTRKKITTKVLDNDGKNGVIEKGREFYEITYNAYDYYKSIQAYVQGQLNLIGHAKKKAAVLNPETMKIYGGASDVKGAEYFANICDNITDKNQDSFRASDFQDVDIVVTADFGDYDENYVRELLETNGVNNTDDIKILSRYPDGITGMKNNSLESLAGFAYCAGFAYYDLFPDKLFNPVSIFAYFYTEFLDVKDIRSNIGMLLGDASLPDGVNSSDINMSEAGDVMIVGHDYVTNGLPDPLPPDEPQLGEFTYGDFFEGDGEINIKDAMMITRYIADINNEYFGDLSNEAKKAGDVDDDGVIQLNDYVILMNYIAHVKVHYDSDNVYHEEPIEIQLPYRHSKIE